MNSMYLLPISDLLLILCLNYWEAKSDAMKSSEMFLSEAVKIISHFWSECHATESQKSGLVTCASSLLLKTRPTGFGVLLQLNIKHSNAVAI